jgi:hypothetical protein
VPLAVEKMRSNTEGRMFGLAISLRAAVDAAAGEITVRAPAPSRRLTIAAGLLSLLLTAVLWQGLFTNHSPSAARGASFAAARSLRVSSTRLSSLPLAAQTQLSQALGAEDPAYRIGGSGDGLAGANPGQRLVERFARSGVSVEAGSTRVGLGLRAVRYDRALRTPGAVAPRARANRVIYARPGITES